MQVNFNGNMETFIPILYVIQEPLDVNIWPLPLHVEINTGEYTITYKIICDGISTYYSK